MQLTIDFDSGTAIYLQLKDQIRYAISVGELKPGDRLPPIRELEAELGVNRNTVRRAYLELQDEGTLTIRQGKGATIAPRASHHDAPPPTKAEELAERMVKEVEINGLDSLNFSKIFQKSAQDHDRRHPKLVFIECNQFLADDLAQAVNRAWGRHVIPLELTQLRARPDSLPPAAKFVLTTHWHVAEIRKLLAGQSLIIRDLTVRHPKTFFENAAGMTGMTTGLILKDAESIPGTRDFLRKLVNPVGKVKTALLTHPEKALDVIRSVDALFYTCPCRGFVKEHVPHGVLSQELLFEPVPEDLDRLKRELDPL